MKEHKANGYCDTCYARSLRHGDGNPNIIKKKQVKACKHCKKVTTIKARGYCANCYQRWKKTGSAERTKIVHYCEIDGCNRPVAVGKLCDVHRDKSQDKPLDKRKATNTHLKRKFGITVDDYEQMHEEQDGVCKICGQPETIKNNGNGNTINLSVDHCHTTGRVRGLLCAKCNVALGSFKDSIDILKKAVEYLK